MIKLKCIQAKKYKLTENEIYDLFHIRHDTVEYYLVKNDLGENEYFFSYRFKDITREFKIKKLLNEI